MTVAILGVGAVGGMIAARAGGVCVASETAAEAIARHGLRLRSPGGSLVVQPDVVERLDGRVDLLVVAVKAYDLERALDRVGPGALDGGSVVLPLLNGLEQLDVVRERLGVGPTAPTVAAGSIGRFEAYLSEPGLVVQLSESAVVTVGSDTLPAETLDRAVAPLRVPGLDVVIGPSERAVLWEKAARLAVMAAATVASGLPVGALLSDGSWAPLMRAALDEACAVAALEGVQLDPAAQWAIMESMPPDRTTSAARDAAARRQTELDAITGSVVRAARRGGRPVPKLERLLAEAESACHAR